MGVTPSPPGRRVVSVLESLAGHPSGLTMTQLAHEVGINRTTCHSIVLVLEECGFVRQDRMRRTYSLGPAVLSLGRAARSSLGIVDAVSPGAEYLAAELQLECVAAMPAGDRITVVASAGSTSSFGVRLPVGLQVPLVPPLGSLVVAWSDEDAVEAWLDRGHLGEDDRARLRKAVVAVRARGYSVTFEARSQLELGRVVGLQWPEVPAEARDARDRLIGELAHEEYLTSDIAGGAQRVTQISVPVFGADGAVAAMLTVNGFPEPLTHDRITWYAERMQVAAGEVMRRLGTRVPDLAPSR